MEALAHREWQVQCETRETANRSVLMLTYGLDGSSEGIEFLGARSSEKKGRRRNANQS
jgi:hypothetical protein